MLMRAGSERSQQHGAQAESPGVGGKVQGGGGH